MGLITNGHRLQYSPWRWHYGALASIYNGGPTLGNGYKAGTVHNWATHTERQTALPQGSLYPAGWMLPRTGGGMSARHTGAGSVSASLIPTRAMTIDLTGLGSIDATASLVVSMLADLTGSGDLAATITGWLNATADLEGAGSLAADMTAIANAVAALSGSGDIDATIRAWGDMTVDIVVTGTGLSTSNVGAAVWGALAASNNTAGTMGEKLNDAGSASNPWTEVIESGYTAAEILQLLAAVAAGKTTITDLGGGNATVVFRNISDNADAVTATMAESARTSVTLNP